VACPHLLLSAVLLRAGQQSIDILCSPGPQQQTRSSGVRRRAIGTNIDADGHRTVT